LIERRTANLAAAGNTASGEAGDSPKNNFIVFKIEQISCVR
jgi:hypothetical protein